MRYEPLFSMLNRATRQHLTRALKKYDLSESNFMLVLRVCETPGISQDQLNHEIYREHSIVTKAVNRLSENGWIRIELAADDKRRTQLFPTSYATTNYIAIKAIQTETEQWLANSLTPDEQAEMDRLLNKMADKLIQK